MLDLVKSFLYALGFVLYVIVVMALLAVGVVILAAGMVMLAPFAIGFMFFYFIAGLFGFWDDDDDPPKKHRPW